MQIEGKVALVTGAAHRVGKAIAAALVREGAHIVVHYGGSADAAQQAAREFEAQGVRVLVQQADLRDPGDIDRLLARVDVTFGRLDILVNSAANFVKRPFADSTVEDWKDVMQTNLRAPFLLTQRAAALMRRIERPADQPAAIVNIADMSGLHYWPGYIMHGMSKAGIIHLTRLTAAELAPAIRVNAVAPGAVLPPQGMSEDSARWRELGARVPLKRTGSAEDVAQAVLFLARHDYITGALIPVDGGEHLIGGKDV